MSTTHWNESEHSGEESNQDTLSSRKRSSRACDQCRKTKSKCEPSNTPGTCKGCALGGNACTFLGPSYKRGPPKGYIQAIEQRWQQVESLLGSLLACQDRRVQDLLADIQQDELAREILKRVDTGPFGPSGRLSQPARATKEDFFACIFQSNEASRDASRSKRQSRISREIVSSSRDHILSSIPTAEWQDRLAARLSRGTPENPRDPGTRQSPCRADGGGPLPQRRRLDEISSELRVGCPDWTNMYTMASSDSEEADESYTNAFGQLSLDENQQVRYHGKASGLHLLIRGDRVDSRVDGGVWSRLPMPPFWRFAKPHWSAMPPEANIPVKLPPPETQQRLIDLYFLHSHSIFPVVHRGRFLREYNEWKQNSVGNPSLQGLSSRSPSTTSEPSQTVSKLLLLSIFSIAARYVEEDVPEPSDRIWDAGGDYLSQAKSVLAQVSQSCRISTCQALLLLGHREFGIGSMEQGWLYIGMAIRMALDLGLNRAADNWEFGGRKLFCDEENQMRKQVWWACCIADKYSSTYMGRPTCIHEDDFDTPLPGPEEYEDDLRSNHQLRVVSHLPTSTLVMRCFREASSLSVIIGSIMSSVYPVKSSKRGSRRTVLSSLEARLDKWYLELPEDLRYDPASKKVTPPPPVLFIHFKYWSAVLLLHRAFLPNWKGSEPILQNPSLGGSNTTSLKAFDLCQSAATYVSTIASTYRDHHNMRHATPFLSPYLLSAGIMHIVTLTLRPSNVQAYIGLQQLLSALKDMQITWPSAGRAWELLHGVKVQVDSNVNPTLPVPDRQKRDADDAFGREKGSDFFQGETFDLKERLTSTTGIQDISTRMMAQMLGLDFPGIEPSTPYYTGYEWWPRATDVVHEHYQQPSSRTDAATPEVYVHANYPSARMEPGWRITPPSYSYGFEGLNQYQM